MVNRVAQALPSTDGIKDQQVRDYLDQLNNHLALRNGQIGTGDERFVTSGELKSKTYDNISEFFSSGVGGGGGAAGLPPKPGDQVIGDITRSIFASQLFQDLGEHIRRISAPYETLTTMNAQVQTVLRALGPLKSGIVRIDTTLADSLQTVTALTLRVGSTESQIVQINNVSAGTNSANALALFQLTARVGTTEANITQLNTITSTSTSALAQATYQLRASLGNVLSTYWQAEPPSGGVYKIGDQWFDTDGGEQHYYWDGVHWVLGNLTSFQYSDAGVLTERNARVATDTVTAGIINHIWASIGGVTANIQDGQLVNINAAQVAFASRWSTVQSAVYDFGTNTNRVAAVDQRVTTTVDLVNAKLNAEYTVRVEVGPNGRTVVGGFGIIGSMNGAEGPRIDFGIRADRFYIASTNSSAPDAVGPTAPFIVQTSDGPWGKAGVYLNSATLIGNTTITTAMIEDQIRSDNFATGVTGWMINSADGSAEFNNIRIRGTATISRLAVEGAVEGSLTVPNNTLTTVTHGLNRKVMLTTWSTDGIVTLMDMTDNAFTLGLGVSSGGVIHYRYW